MAGMISKKPCAGIAAGAVFGFLGLLLLQIDRAPGALTVQALWMSRILGTFLVAVAVGAIGTALFTLWRDR